MLMRPAIVDFYATNKRLLYLIIIFLDDHTKTPIFIHRKKWTLFAYYLIKTGFGRLGMYDNFNWSLIQLLGYF